MPEHGQRNSLHAYAYDMCCHFPIRWIARGNSEAPGGYDFPGVARVAGDAPNLLCTSRGRARAPDGERAGRAWT
jgi:hypothetical protein